MITCVEATKFVHNRRTLVACEDLNNSLHYMLLVFGTN